MDRTCAAPDPAAFPDGEEDKRYARYRAVDKDGLCMVGELLDNGTVMVNKECESRMCCLLFRIFMMSSSLSILNPHHLSNLCSTDGYEHSGGKIDASGL